MDKEEKIIPFNLLKERNMIRKKHKKYPNEKLIHLLLEYHEQCNELFDSCVKSHKLLIEYREKYSRLYSLYTKSHERLRQKQEDAQETMEAHSLMKSFIIKKGLENELRNFIWNPQKN